jgi:hypothetical protein
MNTRLLSRLAVFALVLLVVVTVITAAAAANTVPTSHLTDQTTAITANNLKPAQCASYNLTAIVVCGSAATCNGTNANELMLGSPTTKKINGRAGTNCCIGNPGTTYTNCTWHP